MRRGEVWWAQLDEPAGRRPVVLLSRDEAYAYRELVIVAPLTTRIRGIPAELELGQEDGLPRRCVANCDTLVTIPKARLAEPICTLSETKASALDDALRYAVGLR
ncbi:MAG: type II toxin-antitoxin system PemK/MazF family toxin [Chloroflexi bacterium]|nr:type II toxin-antitoxin system PemK/MazF family toxin [Chloroflexota bacterium]